MRRSFATQLRNLVLAALAPAQLACGETTGTSAASTGDAAATPPLPAQDAGDAGAPEDAADDVAPDCGGPLEAGLEYGASCCGFGPEPLACCHGAVCDPTDDALPAVEGGVACAPSWIAGDSCVGGRVLYPCGVPIEAPSGFLTPFQCAPLCGGNRAGNLNACTLSYTDGGLDFAEEAGGGAVVLACTADCTGRRPATLEELPGAPRSVGDVLARAAYLEAASVEAFLGLACELEEHGAPLPLLRSLRRAAGDEVRHAREVGALARARGTEPLVARLGTTAPRTLLAIALENAREGCVRETWGAAYAVAQSERAGDADVRRVMLGVARDELEHAAIAWELAAWLDERLTLEERAAVADERARAVAELSGEVGRTAPASWRRSLGLPRPGEARAMFEAMRAAVWGAARAQGCAAA